MPVIKKEPTIATYLLFENKQILKSILIVGIILSLILSNHIIIILTLFIGLLIIRFFSLKKRLAQYSFNDDKKIYFLFSSLVNSSSRFKNVYLEDFLFDFLLCDWNNKEELNDYKNTFKKVNRNCFPNNTYTLPKHKNRLIENLKDGIQNIDNNKDDFLKMNIEILRKTLDDIYMMKHQIN